MLLSHRIFNLSEASLRYEIVYLGYFTRCVVNDRRQGGAGGAGERGPRPPGARPAAPPHRSKRPSPRRHSLPPAYP